MIPKGLGNQITLILFQNGELVVENLSSDTNVQQMLDNKNLQKLRDVPRSNASSVIDVASAALSQTGKTSFTVNSSFLESIRSMATPYSSRKSSYTGLKRKLDPSLKMVAHSLLKGSRASPQLPNTQKANNA